MIAFLTYTYSETPQTIEFYKSCERHGITPINMWTENNRNNPKKAVIDFIECLKSLEGYTHAVYMDGGDSFMQRKPYKIQDYVLYQGEKRCFPHPHLAEHHPQSRTEWRYLNGGCWSGKIENLIEFFETCLHMFTEIDENGQHIQQKALFYWMDEEIEIKIDSECKLSQSIAFSDNFEDFEIMEDKIIRNKITNTIPYILHGNGRTDMNWIYNIYNGENSN
jgi:hypothetical protein